MAFTPHEVCLTADGIMNVTKGFEFAFKLGFYVIGVDFLNAAFLEFYIRQRYMAEMQKYGFISSSTLTVQTVYAVMEWVFRAIWIFVSLLQAMIKTSTTGQYCIHELGILEEEGNWLYWLIIFQTVKIGLLSAWHLALNERTKSFFANQFE